MGTSRTDQPEGRTAGGLDTLMLRLQRLRLAYSRVSELTETRAGRLRVWLCLLRGLVEYYVGAVRSDRIRRVRVGRGDNARDVFLRSNGVDTYTFYATFIKGLYDAVLPLPRGAVILDLGANIGLTAAYWLMVCRDAQVIAVEPELGNLQLLRMTLQASEVSIQHAAISERSGTELLELRGVTGHTLVADDAAPRGEVRPVRTVTLDDLADSEQVEHVHLIKADIEGAEVPVFTRSWRLLKRCDAIIMEVHDTDRRNDLVDFLGEQGFRHRVGERVDFPDVFYRDTP